MANYQVLFSGALLEGADRATAEAALVRELGIDERKTRMLFGGRTVVLKSQLDEQDALAWQTRLGEYGLLTRVKNLSPKVQQPLDYEHVRSDHTLRDLTAAHVECPRCSHMQLETSHCARCGIDIEATFKKRRKEDLIIEKKLRALRNQALTPTPELDPDLTHDLQLETFAPEPEPPRRDTALGKLSRLRRWFSRSS